MNSATLPLQNYSELEQKQKNHYSSNYMLVWRQGQLLLRPSQQVKQIYLPAIDDKQWLIDCLKHSSTRLIRVDQRLSEVGLKLWADAAKQANKAMFLRLPSNYQLPRQRRPFGWGIKRLLDWSFAALLLIVLSPVMLAIAVLIRVSMPGPILYRQWRIGQRGKLFQIIKFRTMVVDAENIHHQVMANQTGLHKLKDDPRITPLGRWMRNCSLDELPQLFNVLRGEMSLVGPRPWALYDALRIKPEGQKRLNALPGITGSWQVSARSNMLDLDAVNNFDLEYLSNWSLWKDLKILLLTVPKVLLRSGAC